MSKKLIYVVIVSLAIIVPVLIFLYTQSKNRTEEALLTEVSKTEINFPITNEDPLANDENSHPNYYYAINCTLTNIKHVDIDYQYGTDENDTIKIKTLGTCKYQNSENEDIEVLVALSGIQGVDEQYYIAFGDRSINIPMSESDANLYTGEILLDRWNDHTGQLYDKAIVINPGDTVTLYFADKENEVAKENARIHNGTSDFVFGQGFAQHVDLKSFFETGDTTSLPEFEGGRLIPTIRVSLLEDKSI